MYNKTWISIKNQLIKLLTVQEFLQFPSSVKDKKLWAELFITFTWLKKKINNNNKFSQLSNAWKML